MRRRVALSIAGAGVLLALAGCGRSLMLYGERASWRHQAEVECLKSGGVKFGAGVVQIQPIEGPGMCGADFPLKVSALGDGPAMSYADDIRPPGGIPNSPAGPRWPAGQPNYAPPGAQLRWTPGPAPAVQPDIARPEAAPAAGQPVSIYPPGVEPEHDDIPDDAIVPDGRAPSYPAPTYNRPDYRPPALGPSRSAPMAGGPAALTPPATLACPIVSALERWVTSGVQPAAQHWFGVPVAEIKQISAYSCRSMVGAGGGHISEHAFGNALDVAGFVLADGRKIMVKDGWRGSPEEQGFLHDVQLFACETFSTVLAPGYNVYHYDHIHVDLMRRDSGRRPCRPDAIPGEVVAAKARAVYASKQRGPAYTGSIPVKSAAESAAIAGEDGMFEDDDAAPSEAMTPAPSPLRAPAGPRDAAILLDQRRGAGNF
jgi:hypothetical protein